MSLKACLKKKEEEEWKGGFNKHIACSSLPWLDLNLSRHVSHSRSYGLCGSCSTIVMCKRSDTNTQGMGMSVQDGSEGDQWANVLRKFMSLKLGMERINCISKGR